MKMPDIKIPSYVRFIIAALVILMLGGLTGWYFYLRMQEQSTQAADTGRGFGGGAPSFEGSSGSTHADQAASAQPFGVPAAGNSQISASTSSQELWEADSSAVSGMGFVDTETDEYLYYVERGNGYIFEAHPSEESTARITDTLMPKVYEALFTDDGSVIERSIDASGDVATFLGVIAASSSATSSAQAAQAAAAAVAAASSTQAEPASLVGNYLPPNVQAIAVNAADRSLFYLLPDPHGGVDGYSQQWNGSKKKQIFTSIVGSWRPTILADGTIVVLESPADGLPGYAYDLGASGALKEIAGGIPGLSLLPKASSPLFLFSASSGQGIGLFGVSTTTQRLSISTIADKCVWLPGKSEIAYCAVPNSSVSGNFLDEWYQGLVNTSDDWWKVDLSTGSAQRIYSPSVNNVALDVEDPVIDQTGNYIAFINARDQSLWVLHVAQ